MPYGCGTWPAFWSLGPDWPSHGEIDIIEGVNTNVKNLMSLHTSDNCTTAGINETGTLLTADCYEGANENSGCAVSSIDVDSYGSTFNNEGGGVYAMEWTSQYIRTWFFKRASVPASIINGRPDPSTFGTPDANFEGGCDIDSHFGNHQIVFDITFCGDYAGKRLSKYMPADFWGVCLPIVHQLCCRKSEWLRRSILVDRVTEGVPAEQCWFFLNVVLQSFVFQTSGCIDQVYFTA